MKKRKLKTKSSLKIRFRITKTGKILHMTQNSRHLRRKKRKGTIRGYSVPKIRRVMGIKKRHKQTVIKT